MLTAPPHLYHSLWYSLFISVRWGTVLTSLSLESPHQPRFPRTQLTWVFLWYYHLSTSGNKVRRSYRSAAVWFTDTERLGGRRDVPLMSLWNWKTATHMETCGWWKQRLYSLCVSLTGISNKVIDATSFTFITLAKNYFPLFVQPLKIKPLLLSAEKQVQCPKLLYVLFIQQTKDQCLLFLASPALVQIHGPTPVHAGPILFLSDFQR